MFFPLAIRQSLVRQRFPAMVLKRFDHGGPTAGAVASSKGFGTKEKAVENQWARQHDVEKLKALSEQLKKQAEQTKTMQEEIDQLRKRVKDAA
ncbi:hypothetical protein INT43_000508 [Umbelopsis isabellina]|uniref:ATPase inhibitor, mitochondrial n=1 Tax=Mortierella isabellina TaxID=91625 RepID=A0A8H7UMU2_MORIS|nr:hypothetical protein INT43_000508 [Umbelopsis isabellina]